MYIKYRLFFITLRELCKNRETTFLECQLNKILYLKINNKTFGLHFLL